MRTAIVLGSMFLCAAVTVEAQEPHILGTWKLNVAASRLPPGPPPQVHVRRYSLAPDGTLVGLAVVVEANGRPNFLQFAAKADGKDYGEFDSGALAALQIAGTQPRGTYAETTVDSHTVDWVDKYDGRVTAKGRKWVSADGNTLSFTAEVTPPGGEPLSFLFVFDRTGAEPSR
jgi:hypothetical protein